MPPNEFPTELPDVDPEQEALESIIKGENPTTRLARWMLSGRSSVEEVLAAGGTLADEDIEPEE